MAKSIHPSLSCLLPFYTIPIFPLLNRKIFHLLVSILFFGCTLHTKFILYSELTILRPFDIWRSQTLRGGVPELIECVAGPRMCARLPNGSRDSAGWDHGHIPFITCESRIVGCGGCPSRVT